MRRESHSERLRQRASELKEADLTRYAMDFARLGSQQESDTGTAEVGDVNKITSFVLTKNSRQAREYKLCGPAVSV